MKTELEGQLHGQAHGDNHKFKFLNVDVSHVIHTC